VEPEYPGVLEHALGTVRELDGRGPLRIHRILRSGRFLTLYGVLVLPMLGRSAQHQLVNLLEVLSAAALCLALLNVAALVTSSVLIVIELLLYAANLLILVAVAFKSAIFVSSDSDVFLKLLFALFLSAISAYLCFWIMYPGRDDAGL